MKQKFLIFLSFIILLVVLIGLNAASYVKKEQTPDSEMNPNRSTYNTGATGTRAFYDLLAETGRKVVRWQETMSALSVNDKNKPDVFVFIGQERREITDTEIEALLRWVAGGGRLVVIDREPPSELVKTTANWKISTVLSIDPPFFTDPSDIKQMTNETAAAKPTQPTVFTNRVNAVQPSRYASSILFERLTGSVSGISDSKPEPKPAPTFSTSKDTKYPPPPKSFATPESNSATNQKSEFEKYLDGEDEPNPTDEALKKIKDKKIASIVTKSDTNGSSNAPALIAPVAHLANDSKTLLADFPYGAGRIVYLSDPFIVSNSGINLVDNAQLAINLVATQNGIVAFDEFHQGYGAGQNRLLDYFAGTPLTSIFLQFAALVAVILFTQSRRFARPLPADEPNRLSKLEYVGAMAELQQRTRAFDLAMENIYKDFRRRTARLVGADALKTPRSDLARLIAERLKANSAEIETLLEKCENIMHGEPTNKKQVLNLIGKLREVEEGLGLQRRKKSSRIG